MTAPRTIPKPSKPPKKAAAKVKASPVRATRKPAAPAKRKK